MSFDDFIEHGAHVGGWIANATAFAAFVYVVLRCVLLLQKILRGRRERARRRLRVALTKD